MPNLVPLESTQLTLGGVVPEYTVFSRRYFTGTISDLPYAARLAWGVILFEAEKLRGRVKLPVRDLAKMASITTAEAADALRRFMEPDEFSSSKEYEGRRLLPVEGEEDWYTVATWDKHMKERQAFFNRLRQQRHYERTKKNLTQPNDDSRDLTKEPEPKPTVKNPTGSKISAARLVEEFRLLPKHLDWGAKNCPSVPLAVELEAWKDRMREANYRFGKPPGMPIADPQASFYKACRNAENWGTYAKGGRGSSKKQRQPADHEPFESEHA